MRLHPSLLMLGLCALQVPAAAEGTGSTPLARRQPQAGNPQAPASPIDPQVLAYVQRAYPLADVPASRRQFKQRQIAQGLTAIKNDTGGWYAASFEPFLRQQGAGAASKILEAIAEGRNAAEIRGAAAKILFDALSQKDGAGNFVLPMPPAGQLLGNS